MNIPTLFSTDDRIKILNNIMFKTSYLSVTTIAAETKLSKSIVSKFFTLLTKEGILKKAKQKIFVLSNLKSRAVKILLNLSRFDQTVFKKYTFVKAAGMYGSFVKGTNTVDSDIDLWVFNEAVDDMQLAVLTRSLKQLYPQIRLLYLTKEKIELLKKKDPVFYYSLVFGSISVYGGSIENV